MTYRYYLSASAHQISNLDFNVERIDISCNPVDFGTTIVGTSPGTSAVGVDQLCIYHRHT